MSVRRITPEAAAALMRQGAVYVDVRTVEEFELGHPAGAFNVPWLEQRGGAENPDFVRVAQQALQGSQPVIVGCQTGRRSGPASAALVTLGFAAVYEQQAGYAGKRDAFGTVTEVGWERAGLPTATSAEAGRSYAELRQAAAKP